MSDADQPLRIKALELANAYYAMSREPPNPKLITELAEAYLAWLKGYPYLAPADRQMQELEARGVRVYR